MTFSDSIEVRATPVALFRLTQDYDRRLEWDPFLKEARLVSGAAEPAVGVRAWCVDRTGRGMETEYVSYNPPRAVAVKMTRGPWVIRQFAGSWRFEEAGEGVTRVSFQYHLKARLLLTSVVAWFFRREMRERLEALKGAAEAGTVGERT